MKANIRFGLGAVVILTVVAASAILAFDAAELTSHLRKWQTIVGNELKLGTSRDDIDLWIAARRLIANPGGTQILFDRSGHMHRPQKYGVSLEQVPRLWPQAFSLCTAPIVQLDVEFDPLDKVISLEVHAESLACL